MPVTLIVGPNNSGKSHIRYALQFLFTGKVRDFKQFQASGTMRRQGDKMIVQCETGDGVFIRSLPKKTLDWQAKDESAAMKISLDPLTFVRLPQEFRGNILSQMLRPVDTARKIRSMLALPDRASQSQKNSYLNIVANVSGQKFDQGLVDEWEKRVITERQVAKRQAAEFQEAQRPVITAYNVIDIEMTSEKYSATIKDRRSELERLKKLREDWQTFQSITENIKSMEAEIKDWQNKIDDRAAAKLTDAGAEFATLKYDWDSYEKRRETETLIAAVEKKINDLQEQIVKIDLNVIEVAKSAELTADLLTDAVATGACPTCGTKFSPEHFKQKLEQAERVAKIYSKQKEQVEIAIANNDSTKHKISKERGMLAYHKDELEPVKSAEKPKISIDKGRAKVDGFQVKVTENDKLTNAIRIKRDMIDKIKSAFPKQVEKPPTNIEDKISKLENIIQPLERERAKHESFENDYLRFNAGLEKKQGLDAIITETDRLVKLLGVGGRIRTELVKSGRDVPINDKLVSEWGLVGFNLSESGQIGLKSLDIAVASASEKYRVAAVLGMGLAEIGQVGFCVLDGLEVLENNNKAALLRSIELTGLNNIILIGTDTRDWGKIVRPDWLAVYQCSTDKGVSRMKRV